MNKHVEKLGKIHLRNPLSRKTSFSNRQKKSKFLKTFYTILVKKSFSPKFVSVSLVSNCRKLTLRPKIPKILEMVPVLRPTGLLPQTQITFLLWLVPSRWLNFLASQVLSTRCRACQLWVDSPSYSEEL